jgi:hypothetical protein
MGQIIAEPGPACCSILYTYARVRAEALVDPPVAGEELPRGSRWGVMHLLGTLLPSLDKPPYRSTA